MRRTKDCIVEQRDQRRASATCGNVCRSKIRDHRHSQPRGYYRSFTGLPCARDIFPQIGSCRSLMVDGLAVTSHKVKLALARFLLRFAYGFSIELAQPEIQASKFSHADLAGIHRREHGLADRLGIFSMVMQQQIKAEIRSAALNAYHGNVNAIGGSSTHDSGDDQTLISRVVCSRSSITSPPTIRVKSATIFLSLSTTLVLGSAGKPRSSRQRFLKLSTRCAACATFAANLRSRSAVRNTASKPRHTSSWLWHTRNMSAPARSVSTATSSISPVESTPPISRSSEIIRPL